MEKAPSGRSLGRVAERGIDATTEEGKAMSAFGKRWRVGRRLIARHRKGVLGGFAALVVLWSCVFVYHVYKPLPDGIAFAGPIHRAPVEFLYDLTFRRGDSTVADQMIFDRALAMIDAADQFIVLDMFLFNGEHGAERDYRPLSADLSTRLVAKRVARPDLPITFITDPINNFYGAYTADQISALRDAGVQVIPTRLSRLRDSNPLYSAGWRLFARWFGTGGPGFLPHPLSSSGQRVTARSYLALLNFKANHRKLLVTEDGCLVTSANPHDASSFHSNIAFVTGGPVCEDVLQGERAVAAFSGGRVTVGTAGADTSRGASTVAAHGATVPIQFLTEGRVRAAWLEELNRLDTGDRLDVAVFYLSERSIINGLLDAADRGVDIRLILDPNKDAFGRQKGGIPNRQVAWELRERSGGRIGVRWYETHGEQFHTKLALFVRSDSIAVIGGSANYTRRNLADFNLEADVRLWAAHDTPIAVEVSDYFDRIWSNVDGTYTVDFRAFRDEAPLKRLLYRIQEFTGLCTY